jgi:hypothetical protein
LLIGQPEDEVARMADQVGIRRRIRRRPGDPAGENDRRLFPPESKDRHSQMSLGDPPAPKISTRAHCVEIDSARRHLQSFGPTQAMPAGFLGLKRPRGSSYSWSLANLSRRRGTMSIVTKEQLTAAEQMRLLPGRFKVERDREGWPIIPGRLGRIEWHDPEGRELAVYTDRPRLFDRLLAIPGVRRHQTGDQELRALFPAAVLQQVARLIKARRRGSQPAPKSLRNLRPRVTSPS